MSSLGELVARKLSRSNDLRTRYLFRPALGPSQAATILLPYPSLSGVHPHSVKLPKPLAFGGSVWQAKPGSERNEWVKACIKARGRRRRFERLAVIFLAWYYFAFGKSCMTAVQSFFQCCNRRGGFPNRTPFRRPGRTQSFSFPPTGT